MGDAQDDNLFYPTASDSMDGTSNKYGSDEELLDYVGDRSSAQRTQSWLRYHCTSRCLTSCCGCGRRTRDIVSVAIMLMVNLLNYADRYSIASK